MRTDGETARGNERVIPHVDLESVKEWAKACITASFREGRMVEVGLCAATVTVIGVVLFCLHKALGASAIVGTFP